MTTAKKVTAMIGGAALAVAITASGAMGVSSLDNPAAATRSGTSIAPTADSASVPAVHHAVLANCVTDLNC